MVLLPEPCLPHEPDSANRIRGDFDIVLSVLLAISVRQEEYEKHPDVHEWHKNQQASVRFAEIPVYVPRERQGYEANDRESHDGVHGHHEALIICRVGIVQHHRRHHRGHSAKEPEDSENPGSDYENGMFHNPIEKKI
jgi:hypothetical protein